MRLDSARIWPWTWNELAECQNAVACEEMVANRIRLLGIAGRDSNICLLTTFACFDVRQVARPL